MQLVTLCKLSQVEALGGSGRLCAGLYCLGVLGYWGRGCNVTARLWRAYRVISQRVAAHTHSTGGALGALWALWERWAVLDSTGGALGALVW